VFEEVARVIAEVEEQQLSAERQLLLPNERQLDFPIA
jgi:hypothetical protein